MSSEDESHSVSRYSGALGPGVSSNGGDDSPLAPSADMSREEGEGRVEAVEAPARSRRSRAVASRGSTRPSAGPMFEVSSMAEADAVRIRETYRVPDEFQFRVPGPDGRVPSCPPGYLAVYEEHLLAGLRFPMHPFFQAVLRRYEVVPAQLGPNSIRVLSAFVILCHLVGVEARPSLFFAFFKLNRLPGSKGWYFFGPRKNRKLFGLPSSIHSWKTRFLFLSSPVPWGFRPTWGEPNVAQNRDDRVWGADVADFRLLSDAEVPPLKELLTERNIYDAGISSAVPPAMNRVSGDEIRAAMLKRKAEDRGKKKAAVRKRPRQAEPSAHAGSSALAPPAAAEPPLRAIPESAREVSVEEVPAGVEAGPTSARELPVAAEAASAPSSSGVAPGCSAPPTIPTGAGSGAPNPSEGAPARGARRRDGAASPSLGVSGASRGSSARGGGGSDVRRRSAGPWEESRDHLEFRARIGARDSAIHDPEVARFLARGLIVPRDEEELGSRTVLELMNGPYVHMARMMHDVSGMRRAITKFWDSRRGWEERAAAAERATARVAADRDRATDEASRLREELARAQNDLARERKKSAAELKEKEDELQRGRAEVSRLTIDLDFSEGERRSLADRASNNEERVRSARKEAREAEERASKAEARAAAAEEEISAAVEAYKSSSLFQVDASVICAEVLANYKNSADFRADAAAACVNVYSIGFYDCKKLVEDTFPGLDLRTIVAPGDESEEEMEAEEVIEVVSTPVLPPVSEALIAGGTEDAAAIPPTSATLSAEATIVVDCAASPSGVLLSDWDGQAVENPPMAGAEGGDAAVVEALGDLVPPDA